MRLLLLLLASCTIDPRLVPCGELLCPAGTTCVADELCASEAQLNACEGLRDGDGCMVSMGFGSCDRGVCIVARCGDGVEDPGEGCDDGNQTGGDGCSADCSKRELCGDARLDDGEGCDDGNSNAADGCDACRPTEWRTSLLIGGSNAAIEAFLDQPANIAIDRNGNVIVAERSGNRIRRIDTTGNISTVAGSRVQGFSGEGSLATSALLSNPEGVAVDGLGNVYIADTFKHRILRVDTNGILTRIAGTGDQGYSGDSEPATSAKLRYPAAVFVDGLGTVYVTDTGNHRIRRIDTSGTITTIVGTGTQGSGGDGGDALAAELSNPCGITFDDANTMYIAEYGAHRVRTVDATGIVGTLAGTGSPGFSGDGLSATSAQLHFPFQRATAIAVDASRNVYIADTDNHRIRRVAASSGIITTIAGTGYGTGGDGGPATAAQLASPTGLAFDGAGNLYIAEQSGGRIRRIDASGTIVTVAGTLTRAFGEGAAATSVSSNPFEVAPDGAGNLYLATGSRIRRIDPNGVLTTIAGSGVPGCCGDGDGGPATAARLVEAFAIARDIGGNLFIADRRDHRIRRIDPAGIITTVAGTGTAGFSGDNAAAISAELNWPSDVALDGAGNIYVADAANYRIRRIDTLGTITTIAGTGTRGSAGDDGPAILAELDHPSRIAIDDSGAIYIAEEYTHRVRKIDSGGTIMTVAGTGVAGFAGDGSAATAAKLFSPAGVAIAGSAVYIADRENSRVRRLESNGTITTAVYTGAFSSGDGDGGPANQAKGRADGVATDSAGNLFLLGGGRTRVVDSNGIITSLAGALDPEGMGPVAQARLADPQSFAIAPAFTVVAGGSTGTVQLARPTSLEVVAGRYPDTTVIADHARYRGSAFGAVRGVAYDAAARAIYLTESSSHRVHVVSIVDIDDATTWTIAPLANAAGVAGFADDAVLSARFREPGALLFDEATRQLYVADTGNHTIRAIDLSSGPAGATVRTLAGIPQTRGYFGDGTSARAALLYAPRSMTLCGNGDLFIADTGNHRVRRVAAGTGTISTVLGDGVAASSGEGAPATSFPVSSPNGLACDGAGNLFVTSTTAIRLLPADAGGIVDGAGMVQTIYGKPPRDTFPASVTNCLSGIAVVGATTLRVSDACTGLLIELRREQL